MTTVVSITAGQRVFRCKTCGRSFVVGILRPAHSEAPDLFRPPAGAWLGVMAGEKPGHVTVIGCCSLACAQRFFAERG